MHCESEGALKHGVAKGLILVSLLFVMYINYLPLRMTSYYNSYLLMTQVS